MLELVLLGQPILRVGGEGVTVPTKKALALIAYLSIEGPTPRARLADALWPSIEPEKARGNLRRELNRLRHTPLGDEIISEGAAIALSEPFSSDVRDFLKKIEERDFSGALALYRGPLLDGLEIYDADGFDDWLARRRASLAERQRSTLALEAGVREARGDQHAALQCFLDLIRLDQTQESYHREAMRLHYLVGEREAALERFAELKRVLRRELALEPLPETIELYRTIRAAKQVTRAESAERKSLVLTAPLVGRAAELRRLEQSEHASVVLLAEPGVGKTRLAEEFAKSRPSRLVASASEASSSTPLYPFASALRAALGESDKVRRLAELRPVWRREAARLVPEIEPDAPVDSLREEARARFLEGLSRALAAAVGPGGVLVLDDLHWFDAASIELALHLVRRAKALKISLIATARPTELRTSAAVPFVEALERERLGETMRLGSLADHDVLALVRAMSKSQGAVLFAKRLHAATGGNPLYILETLKSLAASGDLVIGDDGWRTRFDDQTGDYSELPIPSGVRDAVLARVERLGPKVRRLLEAASLAGMRFTLDDLSGATGLGSFDAVDALETAIDAGLVDREGEATRFYHELVRRALDDGLGAERRRLIHEKLAESLARREGTAARVADHLLAAGKGTEAAAFRIRAAEDALKVFAYRDALEQYQKLLALELPVEQAFEAHRRRAAIHHWLDDRTAWGDEVAALEALATRADNPPLAARARLARAELDVSRGCYEDALGSADRALEIAGGDASIEAGALLEGARALQHLGRIEAAKARLARALARAAELEPAVAGDIHRALYACAIEENDLDQAREQNDLARRTDEARADLYALVVARMNDGTIQRRLGDLRAAVEQLEAAVGLAREAGLVSLERTALLSLASAHNLLGEYARAAELASQGIDLAKEPADPLLEVRFENALAAFEYSLGNLSSSIAHSERAIEIALRIQAASWSAFVRMGLGHTYLELGEHARAREVIEAAAKTVRELDLQGHYVVLETHLAHAEIFLENPAQAVERIERAIASGAPPSLDADYTFSILALSLLLAGRPERALETLASHGFRPIHRSLALAVEIDAKRALGRELEKALREAEELLLDPGLTPVESLELRRAVLRGLEAGGDRAHSDRVRSTGAATVRRLVDKLSAYPEIAAGFLARNSDFASAN